MSRLKFTIHGFQQSKLIEHGFNSNAALVMGAIHDFYTHERGEVLVIEGGKFVHIGQIVIHELLPIAGSLKTIQRIYQDLKKKQMIEIITLNHYEGVMGIFLFVRLTDRFYELLLTEMRGIYAAYI